MAEEKKEKLVSMYDPTVNAFRQVPVTLAKKFLEHVEELKENVANAEVEVAKQEAYAKSLKEKKDEK